MTFLTEPIEIESLPLEAEESYVVTYGGVVIKINAATLILLRTLQHSSSLELGYENYAGQERAPKLSFDMYSAIALRLLAKLQAPKVDSKMKLMWWSREIVNTRTTQRMARFPALLFHPNFRWVTVLVSVIVFLCCLWLLPLNRLITTDASILLWVVVIIMNIIVHELGHLGAASAHHVQHNGVGIGIFTIFPVVYVELPKAGLASKEARLFVDSGGVLCQLFMIALFAACGRFSIAHEFYLQVIQISFYMAAIQMLPIFKFDGYWFAVDVFTNGRDYASPVSRSLSQSRELPKNPMSSFVLRLILGISKALLAIWIMINLGKLAAPAIAAILTNRNFSGVIYDLHFGNYVSLLTLSFFIGFAFYAAYKWMSGFFKR